MPQKSLSKKVLESRYNKLIVLKAVCNEGRIYYSNYQKDNIMCYKEGVLFETSEKAFTYCEDALRYVATNLFASPNGNVMTMVTEFIP